MKSFHHNPQRDGELLPAEYRKDSTPQTEVCELFHGCFERPEKRLLLLNGKVSATFLLQCMSPVLHESGSDVVDDARSQQRLAGKVIVARITQGSRPHANYHDRFGYRQERVPGPRH